MLKAISVAIAYQLAWFATAYGAANAVPSIGVIACCAVMLLALVIADDRRNLAVMIAVYGLYGLIAESMLRASGLVVYMTPGALAGVAPLWIVALWMAFGALMPLSMTWLQDRFVLAAVFGATAAPLSYIAASRLDALQLSLPMWRGVVAIAVAWAVVMPLGLWLNGRVSPRR
jgi:Protein of unknown function (DUF2878)